MVTRLLVIALAISFSSLAFAAKGKKNDPAAAEAKREFEIANRYFKAQEYDVALPHYQRAYEASGKRASTIKGLAQCERALGKYADAITHFKEYLATKPRPKDAAAVENTIALLEEKLAAQLAQEEKERAERDRLAREAEEKRAAEEAARRAEEEKRAQLIAPPPPPAAAVEAEDEGSGLLSSPVFWIAAGALVAGGAVAAGVALAPGTEPNRGNTGVFLEP